MTRDLVPAPFLATLLTGAILAGTFVSVLLLPFVAQESDFRVTRRSPGADDAAVTSSYGYAQRYQLYLELRTSFAGAHYTVVSTGNPAQMMLFLPAFASAGSVCAAGRVTGATLESARELAGVAGRHADFVWQGGDPSREEIHRLVAMTDAKGFLVLRTPSGIDAIDRRLLPADHQHECADAR